MGSRVMHYCIASLLSDKLSIVNKTDFLLGGIAPDVHYYMNVSKDITHYDICNFSFRSSFAISFTI
jgi:hypothetical protein